MDRLTLIMIGFFIVEFIVVSVVMGIILFFNGDKTYIGDSIVSSLFLVSFHIILYIIISKFDKKVEK